MTSSKNPLISSQRSSQLQTVLHPLVLLTISDYITRHTLRQQSGPIVGALLGQQNGREVTVEHAFECLTEPADGVEGGYTMNEAWFTTRLEQMVQVHKDRELDLVGWYTLLSPSGPSAATLTIHDIILRNNEAAIFLGFHPTELLEHSVGGKLPLTIYESNYENDAKADDGEDKKMDDGETKLQLRFREVPYSVETDETEMISMNYVAAGSGAAAASKEERSTRSVETNGKGKRRLVESESKATDDKAVDSSSDLTREEDEMIASLTAKSNAIKMLHSRVQLLGTYLERLPPAYISGETTEVGDMDTGHTTPSLPILRLIQALVSRLDLIVPSDEASYDKEMLHETNDVNLLGLLNEVMQSAHQARDVGKKFNIIETGKARNRKNMDFPKDSRPFTMAGAGDIIM